jgi:predicted phosphodiesterase
MLEEVHGRAWLVVAGALAACADGELLGTGTTAPEPVAPAPGGEAAARVEPAPAEPETAGTGAPGAWTFAVISDLHLPNPRARIAEQTIAALIAARVRLVVVTGDHTNGSAAEAARRAPDPERWHAVTAALAPLRDAGIPVLPVAGNHDSYAAWHRDGYARAFADLGRWARPLTINAPTGKGLARPPFSYSVDVDGVHLVLAHVVSQDLDRDVAAWLAADLESALAARHRVVLAHVPLSSVIWTPSARMLATYGTILERGRVGLVIAGHEHVVWDEDVRLPAGGSLRQVLVACSSGFYAYAPSEPAKQRAGCVPVSADGRKEPMRCTMPNDGGRFELARGRKHRHLQHATNGFTLFTVDGDTITARPQWIDAGGQPRDFYLAP